MAIQINKHLHLALLYFIIAAGTGLVLRLFAVFQIPLTYKYLVHTHSHIALLGWVYLALTTLIFAIYLNSNALAKKYKPIFWFTQITILGMLVTFPLQGYGLFSIIFSTLFLFASYGFFWFFMRHTKSLNRKRYSYRCIKYGLWYMVLSSLGPWVLGVIMNTLGPSSIWYRMAIYFYLHFQYNGWMIMALLGFLFFVLEQRQILISRKRFNLIFWSANLGIVLTLFLSALWVNPPLIFNLLGGVGALFQFLALLLIIDSIVKKFSYNFGIKFWLLGIILILKMGLQLISAHPFVAELAATFLDFTIGYLHLTFLGLITIGILVICEFLGLLRISKTAFAGYFAGFLLTEILIFYRGIRTWQDVPIISFYNEFLAIASGLICISLIVILIENLELLKFSPDQ